MDVLKLPKIYLFTTYPYILRKHSPRKKKETKLITRCTEVSQDHWKPSIIGWLWLTLKVTKTGRYNV